MLAEELRSKMERELASLGAHHLSERDDVCRELGRAMDIELESLKETVIKQYHADLAEILFGAKTLQNAHLRVCEIKRHRSLAHFLILQDT